jgi:crotonobetainyl-CoA hydratase
MASPQAIRTAHRDGVLEVVLDRPPANAIDAATSRRLGDVFAAFRDDDALRVAIVTGAGGRFFSAGWDLKALARAGTVDEDYGVGGFGGLQQLPGLDKPVIAAVAGMAVGGGFELALAADLIVASEDARFALPEVHAGLFPDAGSVTLPRRVPHHVALDLLLTGRWMDAAEAARWGLLQQVVPAAGLMEAAHTLARSLATSSPTALAAVKQIVRETAHLPVRDALRRVDDRTLPAVAKVHARGEVLAGAHAFALQRANAEAAPAGDATSRRDC